MSKYIMKRVLLMIPTLIGAGILVFFLMRLIPGDVCELRFAGTGLYVDQEQIDICRSNLGIDRPIFVQFFDSKIISLIGQALILIDTQFFVYPVPPACFNTVKSDVRTIQSIIC